MQPARASTWASRGASWLLVAVGCALLGSVGPLIAAGFSDRVVLPVNAAALTCGFAGAVCRLFALWLRPAPLDLAPSDDL